jgi:hypothetical protein
MDHRYHDEFVRYIFQFVQSAIGNIAEHPYPKIVLKQSYRINLPIPGIKWTPVTGEDDLNKSECVDSFSRILVRERNADERELKGLSGEM